jgi:hypothetical protein
MRTSPTALWIGQSSLPSPGCCRDGAGAPSSSRQRRSFVGTESSRGANGGAGDQLDVLVQSCPSARSQYLKNAALDEVAETDTHGR